MNEFPQSEKSADEHRLVALKPRLMKRAKIIDAIRLFFKNEGFLEIETPTRIQAPAPEEHIDAEPSGDSFLIASPELQMKRLVAAGYSKIFQICHCFRKGERGDRHLPEFTMIEWYRSGAAQNALMVDCENLLAAAAKSAGAFPIVTRFDDQIDLRGPFERLEVSDAFEQHAGWRPGAEPDPDRFDRDLVEKVEPSLPTNRPVFLVGYPAAVASLAQLDPGNPARAMRFELYAGGLELANGFQELTDAGEQRRRFVEATKSRSRDGKDPYPLDERFLSALAKGLPPCAGIALGIDRLVMLLTGAPKIDDVVAFHEGTL